MVGYSNFHKDQIGSFLGPLYVCAMLGLTYVLVGAPPIFAQVTSLLFAGSNTLFFLQNKSSPMLAKIHFFS